MLNTQTRLSHLSDHELFNMVDNVDHLTDHLTYNAICKELVTRLIISTTCEKYLIEGNAEKRERIEFARASLKAIKDVVEELSERLRASSLRG